MAALAALLLAVALGWPRAAYAGECDGFISPGLMSCTVDVAEYGAYESAAESVWLLDRMLLGGAYWLDALRDQFVQVIFAGAYAALSSTIGSLLGPVAVLALALGALALIALPITGASGPLNIRTIMLWGIIGPLLLTLAGPYLVEFEQIRTDLGATLFDSVAGQSFRVGAGATHDMTAPTRLYPSGDCGADTAGQPLLLRYHPSELPQVDEQVAALVWADAKDIHCPDRLLPMRFFQDGADGPGYLLYKGIYGEAPATRQRYIEGAKAALNRLLLAVAPAFVALLIALLNLVFACCAILLWFALPIGILFSFFQTNSHWFAGLVQRAANILKTSWTISLLLGVFAALLLDAGVAGDALRYSILTIISGVFVARFLISAFGLFADALAALSAATGLESGGPSVARLAGGAAGLAAGAVTGGAGAALTMALAAKQTGSGRYALAAAAGRFRPLMQLGEVAAGMGLVDDEIASGMAAGHSSRASLRAGRLAMRQDGQRQDDEGLTLRDHAADRRIARAIDRAERGSLFERSIDDAHAIARFGHGVAAELHDPQHTRAALGRASAAAESVREVLAHPAEPVRKAGAWAARRAHSAAEQILRPPDRRLAALAIERGRTRRLPRFDEARLPEHAERDQIAPARMRALLRKGYTVQRNPDGSTTYWRALPASAAPTDKARGDSAPEPDEHNTAAVDQPTLGDGAPEKEPA